MADISIEETNRLRISMGMQPLPVGPVFKDGKNDEDDDSDPASTLETRQAAAGDNWQKLQAEAEAKARRQAQKDEIRKARERAQRFAQLEGKGLGDVDDEGDLDTTTWLRQQKKRQKKIEKARKLAEELAAREKEQELQAQYTEADLAGIRVGHEIDQFDGGDQILTLKDAAVDDEDEEDELENLDLRDKEKLQEKLESKKRKPVYNPLDDDGTGEKKILAQYDEEIDGKKRKRFTLDGQGSTRERIAEAQNDSGKSKGIQISLDLLKDDVPISDYQDAPEIKIKKPKKKKTKTSRKRAVDDDDIFPTTTSQAAEDSMDVDNPATGANAKPSKFEETNFVDDEDLQADLATQRRAALKKRKKLRPEDFARQLKEEAAADANAMETAEDVEDEPGLVLDETSEFVAGLERPPSPERKPRTSTPLRRDRSPESDEDGDHQMQEAARADSADVEGAEPNQQNITATGLDEESTLDNGLAGTLGMLRQRGLIKDSANDMNSVWRDRQRFLAEKHRREEDAEALAKRQREKDRLTGVTARMTPREKEEYARKNNAQRDQYESRKLADMFNQEYKPNIELKYVDEHGRRMGQKEAFKHLSHQFHGKGSGKGKTEKRLKKIEDEKKREAMSTLDSSQHTGMHNAQATTSRNKGQAGVRLQ
jgi:U4/U6.U5 tri-snRNP-associated protein 1